YNPEVYWQFSQAIQGMGAACRKFGTPVTGGNVSLYNQSDDGPVFPTPTIGMVGTIEDVAEAYISMGFQQEGDSIYVLGTLKEEVGSSSYVYHYHKIEKSPAPYVNLDEELSLQTVVLDLISQKLIQSAHDVSDGGLAITLLESGFAHGLGAEISCPSDMRKDAFLFGEGGGRVVVSVNATAEAAFEHVLKEASFPYMKLGTVSSGAVQVDDEKMGSIAELKGTYQGAIGKYMIPALQE
ncbi:MAG: AIR synthase-related protein, partial [Bacteroidota bacterium]